MLIYWILIISTAIVGIPLCGLSKKSSGARVSLFCGIFAVAFTVIAGIRLSVGYDYNSYATGFYNMNFRTIEEIGRTRTEMGMRFPVKIIEIFTYDYVPSFIFLAILMYPPLMNYIRKYSDNPWVSVFAFLAFGVFFNSLNFMRQFFAAICCAYAYRYAEKGNFFRFAVFVLLGACFHRSAFLVLPCYIFTYISMNGFVLILTLMTSISAYLLSNDILGLVTQYFYKSYDPSKSREVINGLTPVYTIMFGIVFVAAYLLKNRINGSKHEKNILLWCSYGCFLFELIGTKHAIVSRLALLFIIPNILLLVPKIWCAVMELIKEKLPAKNVKLGIITATLVMTVSMGLLYNNLINRNYNGVMPYQTIAVRGDT